MTKVIKSLKYAIILCLSVNVLGFIVGLTLSGFSKTLSDYNVIAPLALSVFFVPSYLAFYNYDIKYFKNYKQLFKLISKTGVFSFIAIYFLAYIIVILKRDVDLSFSNIISLMNGIIAVFISIFCILVQYLLEKRLKGKANFRTTYFSLIKLFSIWGATTTLYLIIISLGSAPLTIYYISSLSFLGLCSVGITCKIMLKGLFATNSALNYFLNYTINIFAFPILFLLMYTSWHNTSFHVSMLVSGVTILGAYFLFLTLFIHFYHFYESNKYEKETLKQIGITASLQYQQLKVQLSPHFLFNNISVLTALIEENPKKAIKFSEGLSRIYRYFLTQEKQDIVRLKEELEFAIEYLNLLKVRYENALTYSTPEQIEEDYYILPLVLQQVFENVVKHNEISAEMPLNISMYIKDHYLIISNQINPKLTKQKNGQTGLLNITNRYVYFTDKKVIINIDTQNYTIKLPILKVQK